MPQVMYNMFKIPKKTLANLFLSEAFQLWGETLPNTDTVNLHQLYEALKDNRLKDAASIAGQNELSLKLFTQAKEQYLLNETKTKGSI